MRHAIHVTTSFYTICKYASRPQLLIVRGCCSLDSAASLNGTRRDINEMQIAVNTSFRRILDRINGVDAVEPFTKTETWCNTRRINLGPWINWKVKQWRISRFAGIFRKTALFVHRSKSFVIFFLNHENVA